MKHRIFSIFTFILAINLCVSSLTACQNSTQGDWRDEVTSVMDQLANTTAPTISGYPSGSDPNNDRLHPLTNPDADVIPSVSYGSTQSLIYKNQVYVVMQYDNSIHLLCSVNLSEMVEHNPDVGEDDQPVPPFTPLCFNPFCEHNVYEFNNGIICPLYFDLMKSGQVDAGIFAPIFCIDYTESKGESPVFYICAPEPEYRVIGGQVELNKVTDIAIYRYDSGAGERSIIAENLSTTIYTMDICGDFIIYGDESGLTAIDKSGKVVGNIQRTGEDFNILDRIDGRLYIADSMGKVYTADVDLSNFRLVYTYDTSDMDQKQMLVYMQRALSPAGMTINDGYLYYCDDYTIIEEAIGQTLGELFASSIYRVPLANLSAEPELIVDGGCYGSSILGITDGTLYFTPVYRRRKQPSWMIGSCLASVNLSDKKVTVLETDAFDMPDYSRIEPERLLLTSEFIIGPSLIMSRYDLLVLYHFESGAVMYIDRSYHWWVDGK